MFTFNDTRYNRQLVMPEWGPAMQAQLASARVACVGAGGVKSTLLMCLAAAGVGTLRIVEHDHVELSNLNRQLLFATSDIGRPKVVAAQERLQSLNPTITIEAIEERVTEHAIANLLGSVDVIIEGGDSPAGRNLINTFCLERRIPFVHASAQFSYGYVFSVVPERLTACYACLFPRNHERTEYTGPVPVNVLATSLAGSLGAAEVLKYLSGRIDDMHINQRLCFSSLLLSGEFSIEDVLRNRHCPACSRYYG